MVYGRNLSKHLFLIVVAALERGVGGKGFAGFCFNIFMYR